MIGRYIANDVSDNYSGSLKNSLRMVDNGAVKQNTPLILLDSTGTPNFYGNSSNLTPLLYGRNINFSDLEEDATYGYVVDSGDVSRDGSGNLVLTAKDTDPVTMITLPVYGTQFLFESVALKLTLAVTSEYTGGATLENNSRFGFRCWPVGNAAGEYFEVLMASYDIGKIKGHIFNNKGGISRISAANATTVADITTFTMTVKPDVTSGIHFPSLYAEIARDWNDGVVRANPGATRVHSAGLAAAYTGFDWNTTPTQGFYFSIYADQGAMGTTVVASLEIINVNSYPSSQLVRS